MINTEHLKWPTKGWGYLPLTNDVLGMLADIQQVYRPTNVLEIGYHMGHSTTYMLEMFPQANVISIAPEVDAYAPDDDWISTEERIDMSYTMIDVYPNRWMWLRGRTGELEGYMKELYTNAFDFALVDGQHQYRFAKKDINLCKQLDIPLILVDNVDRKDVAKAVKDAGGYAHIRTYSYVDNWKGKSQPTQIGLYQLL